MRGLRGEVESETRLSSSAIRTATAGSCRRARQPANGPAQADWCARICARSASVAVVGVDAYRENLRKASRRAPDNALYIVANALALPRELGGMASKVTISRRGDPARLTLARFLCSSGGTEQRGATLTQACLRLHRESPD